MSFDPSTTTSTNTGSSNNVQQQQLPAAVTPKIDFVIETSISTISFGSCHKNKYANAQIWDTIQKQHYNNNNNNHNPTTSTISSAFLWVGDAIYPPVRNIASIQQLQNEYDNLLHNTSIGYTNTMIQNDQNHHHIDIFGTWDDHDYGGNDRGNDMPQKQERANLYWKFINHTAPSTISSSLTTTTTRGEANRISQIRYLNGTMPILTIDFAFEEFN